MALSISTPAFKRYGENTNGTNNDILKNGCQVGDLVILWGFHDTYGSPPNLTNWPTPGWTIFVNLTTVGTRQAWGLYKIITSADLAVAWTWPNGLTNHGTAATVVVSGADSTNPVTPLGAFWQRGSGSPAAPDQYSNVAPSLVATAGAPGKVLVLSAEATSAADTSNPTVQPTGTLLGSSWDTNSTWLEQTQVYDVGTIPNGVTLVTNDTLITYQNVQATNGCAIQLAIREPAGGPPPTTEVSITTAVKRQEATSASGRTIPTAGAQAGDSLFFWGYFDSATNWGGVGSNLFDTLPPSVAPGSILTIPAGTRTGVFWSTVLTPTDLASTWYFSAARSADTHGTYVVVAVSGDTDPTQKPFLATQWTRAGLTANQYLSRAPGTSITQTSSVFAMGMEATAATGDPPAQVSGATMLVDSLVTNNTWVESVQAALVGDVIVAPASTGNVDFTFTNAQVNNGGGGQVVVPLADGGTPPQPATAVQISKVLDVQGSVSTGYLYVGTAAGNKPVTQIRQVRGKGVQGVTVWDVPTMQAALVGGGLPRVAHRGGSADHPEMSLFAYTMAATRGFPALEMSLGRTSDGVWFGLHDQNLTRVTAGASSANANALTWSQVQAFNITASITSDPSQPDRPFCRIEQLLDAYGLTHCIFVDPKYALAQTGALLDLIESWYVARGVSAQQHVVFKYYGIEDGNGALTAQARGFTTWGYFYSADLPNLATYQARWTWLGLSYNASSTDWGTILAVGKPVLAHIPTTEAQVQQGFAAGGTGAMVAGTEQAFVVPVKNSEGVGPQIPFILGETRPTRDNVGVTMGGYPAPTIVRGDGSQSILYIESGQVVEDRIIRSWVRIRPGGILRRCIIAGPDVMSAANLPMVFATGGTWTGSNPAIIENCTFAPGMYAPTALRAGFSSSVGGNRYIARYCVATGGRDGFQSTPTTAGDATSVRLEGCWVGELMHLVPDDYTGKPDTHNDCYQEYGSQNTSLPTGAVTMIGCTFEATRHPLADPLAGPDRQSTAGVMLSKSAGNYSNIVVDRCWFRAGLQQINAVPATPSGTMKLSVQGCRLERGTADGGSPAPDEDGVIAPFVAAYVGNYVDLSWGTERTNTWTTGGIATPIRAN